MTRRGGTTRRSRGRPRRRGSNRWTTTPSGSRASTPSPSPRPPRQLRTRPRPRHRPPSRSCASPARGLFSRAEALLWTPAAAPAPPSRSRRPSEASWPRRRCERSRLW
uniref:Uncharacterized protein n=1 Tax=Arundo donax TaxID=35708 RepID=A0A0A9D6M1_ARUDO